MLFQHDFFRSLFFRSKFRWNIVMSSEIKQKKNKIKLSKTNKKNRNKNHFCAFIYLAEKKESLFSSLPVCVRYVKRHLSSRSPSLQFIWRRRRSCWGLFVVQFCQLSEMDQKLFSFISNWWLCWMHLVVAYQKRLHRIVRCEYSRTTIRYRRVS